MNSDPRTNPVTARIIFEGVMLMCINQRQEYEVGMIKCPHHEPKINVVESTVGHEPKEYNVDWPAGHDLMFQVKKPESNGVTLFHSREVTDFNKVIDLEGQDFHDQGVTVDTALLQGRRLAITDGIAYAHELSEVKFDLLTWEHDNDAGTVIKNLGQIADQVGVKIVCRDEPFSGIDLVDYTTGAVIKSLAQRDTVYVITIDNDCRREDEDGPQGQPGPVPDPEGEMGEPMPAPPVGTDFRFYYGLLQSKDGRKFDLAVNVEKKKPGDEEGEPDDEEHGPQPSPGVCETAFLSQTGTLGLHG